MTRNHHNNKPQTNPWRSNENTQDTSSYKTPRTQLKTEFQQCGILTSVDSDGPVQPPFKLRYSNSKLCSVSSLTLIEYSSNKQRLWSDCAYAQADRRLCWSHIPHCWKTHVADQVKQSASCSSARGLKNHMRYKILHYKIRTKRKTIKNNGINNKAINQQEQQQQNHQKPISL